MKTEKTFKATIHVGLYNRDTKETKSVEVAREICQQYVDEKSDRVSFTQTEYIYKNGREPGLIVEFIQYPRFPREEQQILDRALELAQLLKDSLEQYKVTVICPETTYMLSTEPAN